LLNLGSTKFCESIYNGIEDLPCRPRDFHIMKKSTGFRARANMILTQERFIYIHKLHKIRTQILAKKLFRVIIDWEDNIYFENMSSFHNFTTISIKNPRFRQRVVSKLKGLIFIFRIECMFLRWKWSVVKNFWKSWKNCAEGLFNCKISECLVRVNV
jgi:hypothetical protein